jgi:hypothetical protein
MVAAALATTTTSVTAEYTLAPNMPMATATHFGLSCHRCGNAGGHGGADVGEHRARADLHLIAGRSSQLAYHDARGMSELDGEC